MAYRYHKFNDQNENNPKAEKSAIHVAFCKSCLNVDDEVEKEDDDDDHDVKSDSKTTWTRNHGQQHYVATSTHARKYNQGQIVGIFALNLKKKKGKKKIPDLTI